MPIFVKGPFNYSHNKQTLRPGQEVTELSEEDKRDGLATGVLFEQDEAPTDVAPHGSTVTNPAALHPTAAYGVGPENDPFAAPQNTAEQQQATNIATGQQTLEAPVAPVAASEPATTEPQIDPATGQPVVSQPEIDPATGQPVAQQPQIDPATGLPVVQIDPATGQPVQTPNPNGAGV